MELKILGVVHMDNGEVISMGKIIGQASEFGKGLRDTITSKQIEEIVSNKDELEALIIFLHKSGVLFE